MAIYYKIGDRSGVGYALRSLANVAFAQADHATARALCEESLEIARELGDRDAIGALLGAIGEAAGEQGDYPAARQLLEECLAMARESGDRRGTGWTLGRLGGVAYAEKDYSGARDLLNESLSILHEVHDGWGIASALEGLALVALPFWMDLGRLPASGAEWNVCERSSARPCHPQIVSVTTLKSPQLARHWATMLVSILRGAKAAR